MCLDAVVDTRVQERALKGFCCQLGLGASFSMCLFFAFCGVTQNILVALVARITHIVALVIPIINVPNSYELESKLLKQRSILDYIGAL